MTLSLVCSDIVNSSIWLARMSYQLTLVGMAKRWIKIPLTPKFRLE